MFVLFNVHDMSKVNVCFLTDVSAHSPVEHVWLPLSVPHSEVQGQTFSPSRCHFMCKRDKELKISNYSDWNPSFGL